MALEHSDKGAGAILSDGGEKRPARRKPAPSYRYIIHRAEESAAAGIPEGESAFMEWYPMRLEEGVGLRAFAKARNIPVATVLSWARRYRWAECLEYMRLVVAGWYIDRDDEAGFKRVMRGLDPKSAAVQAVSSWPRPGTQSG